MSPLTRSTTQELVLACAASLLAVAAVLLGGQVARLGELLWVGGATKLVQAFALGVVAMAGAILPLVGLIGAGVAYGRQRAEGVWLAHSALGLRPWRALAPAATLGVALGGLAAWLSTDAGPRAVTALRDLLVDAAGELVVRPGRPVQMPGGGVLWRSAEGADVWVLLPPQEAPILVHAAAVVGAADRLTLQDARVFGRDLRVAAGQVTVDLDREHLKRRLGTLGHPNGSASAALDRTVPRDAFVWHRRWAMAAAAPLWAVLGGLLGAALGGGWAALLGAGVVAGAYGLLRTGELAARAGELSPWLGAWAPTAALLLLLLVVGPSLARRAT